MQTTILDRYLASLPSHLILDLDNSHCGSDSDSFATSIRL